MTNRVPYWDDLRWDDEGDRIYDGTCLPVNDHQAEVSGWGEGSYNCKIICPEANLGGCVLTNDGKRQECWMIPWMDNIATELIDESDVKIWMQIQDTSQEHMLADEEGFTFKFVTVLGIEETT